MSKPKDDHKPAKAARAPRHDDDDDDEQEGVGTVEAAPSPAGGPGVDPSTGAPTPASPGEPVDQVHAVHPGRHTLPGAEAEVHPPDAAPAAPPEAAAPKKK